jgi:hypothetical protein
VDGRAPVTLAALLEECINPHRYDHGHVVDGRAMFHGHAVSLAHRFIAGERIVCLNCGNVAQNPTLRPPDSWGVTGCNLCGQEWARSV